jgi:hypothetical protein
LVDGSILAWTTADLLMAEAYHNCNTKQPAGAGGGHVIFRVELAAHGGGTVAWAKQFPLEAFPTELSWEVQVLAARRHWGGGQDR